MSHRSKQLDEIRGSDEAKLTARLSEIRGELFKLRSQLVTQKLHDHTQLGKLRKEAARIRTLLGERARASAAPVAVAPKPAAPKANSKGRVGGTKGKATYKAKDKAAAPAVA